MQKIKLLEKYKKFKKGSVIVVGNNIAHTLIDSGKAMLANVMKIPKDKMTRMYKKIRTK